MEHYGLLTVREAVYDGTFSTPKTQAGPRQIPLSDAALRLIVDRKAQATNVAPDLGTARLPNRGSRAIRREDRSKECAKGVVLRSAASAVLFGTSCTVPFR
jgi:hypothetical protein